MKNWLVVLIACLTTLPNISWTPKDPNRFAEDFKNKFFMAKSFLARGDTEKALPIYEELYLEDTTNANISYLLGVCYTEKPVTTNKSIYHLKKGTAKISDEYNPATHMEEKAPIFAWYYLTIAYSQNNRCMEAIQAAEMFKSLYGTHKSDFYTRDAVRWVKRCNDKMLENVSMDVSDYLPPEQVVVTKTVDYTTTSPLYAVQVGAFSRLIPIWKFDNLNNVDAFMDKRGIIRYVIGHFPYVSQANALLKMVWKAGYKDAFIVNINDTRKFDDHRFNQEVVSVNDVSFKAVIRGKVDYRVQIGAFRESIPEDLLQLYLSLDGIRENQKKDLTILTIGSHDLYDIAAQRRLELQNIGIPGVFVVAYNYNRQVTIEEANNYLKKKAEKE